MKTRWDPYTSSSNLYPHTLSIFSLSNILSFVQRPDGRKDKIFFFSFSPHIDDHNMSERLHFFWNFTAF
jgi:hypothetical protein